MNRSRRRRDERFSCAVLTGLCLTLALVSLPRSTHAQIVGLETATAGFVGQAEQGPLDQPVLVESLGDFLTIFGGNTGGLANPYLAPSAEAFFANGGQRLWVVRVAGANDASLIGAVANAGSPATGLQALAEIDDVAVVAIPGATTPAIHVAMIAHCEGLADRICLLDPTSRDDVSAVLAERSGLGASQGFAALYFPWIEAAPAGVTLELPPSGFVAGVFARSDASRGVWASPAGANAGALIGATDLTYAVSTLEQEQLNPSGVNAIRGFPGAGILVFGARTLSTDVEWIYLAVRRFASWVEECVEEGTAHALSAPNDATLWAALESEVGVFLQSLYLQGAFAGTQQKEAWFVRCDVSTMTPLDLAEGRTIIQLGIAALAPSEFVILQIVHTRPVASVPGLTAVGGALLGIGVLALAASQRMNAPGGDVASIRRFG